MQVPLLIFAFVTVLVRMAFGQNCDDNKIIGCVTTMNNTITNDPSIAKDQSRLCNVYQMYVNCVLKQACNSVPLEESTKDQIRQFLKQSNIPCNLNLNGGSSSGASVVTAASSVGVTGASSAGSGSGARVVTGASGVGVTGASGDVTVLVNMAFGQRCDTNKITGCLTTMTDTIKNNPSIAQDESRLCNVFQRYVDCVLKQACNGVSLPDNAKDQIRQELRQLNLNCNLNLDGVNGAAAGMSSPLLMVLSFFAAVGVFFAL